MGGILARLVSISSYVNLGDIIVVDSGQLLNMYETVHFASSDVEQSDKVGYDAEIF